MQSVCVSSCEFREQVEGHTHASADDDDGDDDDLNALRSQFSLFFKLLQQTGWRI